MKANANKLRTCIGDKLNSLSETLIDELIRVKNFKIHPETASFDFEVHANLSIVLYPMDSDMNQILGDEGDKKNYFVGHYVPSLDLEKELHQYVKDFLNNDEEYYNTMIIEIIEWFSRCWNKAIVTNYTLPTFISEHDSSNIFDLSSNMWMNQDYQNGNLQSIDESEFGESNVIDVWIDPDFLKEINKE
jgi:hypothetical protein